MGSSSAIHCGHQNYMFSGCPLCGLHGPCCCGRATTVGTLVVDAGSQPDWLPGPALCRGCWSLVGGVGHRAAGRGPGS